MPADRILSFSDLHVRETGSFPPWCQIINGRGLTGELENIVRGIDFVCMQIVEHQPRLVLFCGDWHHCTDSLTALAIYVSGLCHAKVRRACDEVGAEFWMLPGQHDIFSERFCINSINVFQNSAKIFPTETIKDIDGFRIVVLPFTSCKELAGQTLSEMSSKENYQKYT